MNRLFRQTMVIARRDFMGMVATPTFLIFLLAPLIMIGFSLVGGIGASQLADSAASKSTVVFVAGGEDAARIAATDGLLRKGYSAEGQPAALKIVTPDGSGETQARTLFSSRDRDVYAVAFGPLDQLTILKDGDSVRAPAYLRQLAEAVLRDKRANIASGTPLGSVKEVAVDRVAPSQRAQQGLGYAAVFVLFLITLLLAGQAVGMLAEEKGNKVIEILAAAVPLETVFFGKLIGMFGVALLFIAFWGLMAVKGIDFLPPKVAMAAVQAPAVGWPLFILLGIAYFTMAYLLLGAMFLSVGAQAATVREIQMLSLPVTILQMTMFGLASAAASAPNSTLARFAEILPFSSPFAMEARAATDPALWPHAVALAWQLFWVVLMIFIGAWLFRRGVLKSGSGGFRLPFRRKSAPDSAAVTR